MNDAPSMTRVPTTRELYDGTAARDPDHERALERNFFASLRLRNGTFKITYPRRLDDLNALVGRVLPAARPLRIMDVASSSGVSTLEWMAALEAAGVAHHMTAGDATVHAFLLSVGRRLHVLTDATGYPLQFDVRGVPIPTPLPARSIARHLAGLAMIRTALAVRFRALRDRASYDPAPAGDFAVTCRRITLMSPRLGRPANLSIVEDDVLDATARWGPFDVLRAANILNRSYFDDATLAAIVANLRARLVPGGLLVVCRTNDRDENHATVFELGIAGRFVVRARLRDGSEIEPLVAAR